MYIKLLFSISLFFFLSFNINSQNIPDSYEIGYIYDINYDKMDGFYDKDYKPSKSIHLIYDLVEEYNPGYYYDLNKVKINGLLKYSKFNTCIRFKADSNSVEKIIKPDSCLGYVLGLDTFAVIDKYKDESDSTFDQPYKKEFAQFIEKIGAVSFYKQITIGVKDLDGFIDDVCIRYLYKVENTLYFKRFPKGGKKLKELEKNLFVINNVINQYIDKGEYNYDKIPLLIKLFKYKYCYDNNIKILFSNSWEEVNNINKATFFAQVESIEDSIFHLKYYYNNCLLFEGHYSSFYNLKYDIGFFINNKSPLYQNYFNSKIPLRKTGEFIWYYPNGNIRKKATFNNDIQLETFTYYKNGKLQCEYNIVEGIPQYIKVFTENGENALDKDGKGHLQFYDSLRAKEIIYEYKNFNLSHSYYLDSNNRRVYLICKKNAKFRGFDFFDSQLQASLTLPNKSVKEYKYAIAFIKCIVEPTGKSSDISIIKSIDPECEKLVLKYLTLENVKHFIPAKFENKKVVQEILIPITFIVEGFANYNFVSNRFNFNFFQTDPFQIDQSNSNQFRGNSYKIFY